MSTSTPSYTDRAKAGLVITVDKLRAFDTDRRTNACRKALARARSYAAETRAAVDAYTAPLFAKYEFFNDLEVNAGRAERSRITDQKMLYLSQDEATCRKFYDECFAAAKEAGYDVVDDQCPALMAEHAVVRLENALLELAANVFGINFVETHGDLRKRAIKLLSETCRR
jgi:hypothetical protein